ncbi:PREDICTED: UPF0561 protein C2orf68 homolog isoform X2 [Colobus angolensis palliatus]|uniref:Uncharacterized protein n=1 Tax=Colobus angolensis palliatus TaxID=336983 RepID=A0A2K5KCS5_COLAP|nr:PREDICTED: UPF0561 protein C2orf68 homolog isoform X2 [Colobus angolensis palliatus]
MEVGRRPRPGHCCKPGGRLDLNHGFVHHIRRNQIARDDYDKKVKQAAKEKVRRRHTPAPTRPRKPDLQVYLPRHRGEAARPACLQPARSSCNALPFSVGRNHFLLLRFSSPRLFPEPPPQRSQISAEWFSPKTGTTHKPPVKHRCRREYPGASKTLICRFAPPCCILVRCSAT